LLSSHPLEHLNDLISWILLNGRWMLGGKTCVNYRPSGNAIYCQAKKI
jgi:hypothetical protein